MIYRDLNSNLINSILNDIFYPVQEKQYYTYSNTGLKKESDRYIYQTPAIGLDKKDIDIQVKNNTLLINSNVSKERLCEISNNINHSIKLKEKIDINNVVAKLEKGILKITLPFLISKKEDVIKINIV